MRLPKPARLTVAAAVAVFATAISTCSSVGSGTNIPGWQWVNPTGQTECGIVFGGTIIPVAGASGKGMVRVQYHLPSQTSEKIPVVLTVSTTGKPKIIHVPATQLIAANQRKPHGAHQVAAGGTMCADGTKFNVSGSLRQFQHDYDLRRLHYDAERQEMIRLLPHVLSADGRIRPPIGAEPVNTRFKWVTVMNPGFIQSDNVRRGLWSVCSVDESGTVLAVGTVSHQTVYLFSTADERAGAQCPSGTLFTDEKTEDLSFLYDQAGKIKKTS
jgi:hypothetical protein